MNDPAGSRLQSHHRTVILFTRVPSAAGKTRLTATLSDRDARALREALLLDTCDALRGVAARLVVAFTPADAETEIGRLVGDATRLPQRGNGLAEQMQNAVDDALDAGAGAVALVGSDLPSLPPQYVNDAFTMLDRDADLVLGPSEDGGFYLLATRRSLPAIFEGIEWGTASVLARVVEQTAAFELTIGFAREWWDVDTLDDLQRVSRETAGDVAVRTRRLAMRGHQHGLN